VLSCPWADYELILLRKKLQLDALGRNKFRVKAGAWYGRPPKEDVDAGLADPWNPQSSKKLSGHRWDTKPKRDSLHSMYLMMRRRLANT
jgi:hypothetical protein